MHSVGNSDQKADNNNDELILHSDEEDDNNKQNNHLEDISKRLFDNNDNY